MRTAQHGASWRSLTPGRIAHHRSACWSRSPAQRMIALTVRCCGHSIRPAARGTRPVDRRLRRSVDHAGPARAVVDPDPAHRRGGDGRRPARGIRRHHAGTVSQSARRSGAGRRFSGGAFAAAAAIVFTDSRIGESLRFMQNQLLPLAAFAGSLVDDHHPLRHRQPFGGAPRSRFSCWRGSRSRPSPMPASGLLVFIAGRPPAARHHVLAAGLAERGDLDQDRNARAGAGARRSSHACGSRAGSTCWCSAKPRLFTAASTSSA